MEYDAFITCCPAEPDRAIAARLKAALERFRPPKALIARGAPHRLRHVYLDAGGGPEGFAALAQSRFLVVICSPATPASDRVSSIIDRFRECGRGGQILALLVAGEPADAFPRALREVRRSDGAVEEIEPLAADVRSATLAGALRLLRTESLRVLAPILGCSFDDLRQRQRERLLRRLAAVAGGVIGFGLLFGSYALYQERVAAQAYEAAVRAEAEAVDATRTAVAATERAEAGEASALVQTAAAETKTKAAEAALARAEPAEAEATKQRAIAEARTREAEAERAEALAQRQAALRGQSLYLADMARRDAEAGNSERALLLGLEALRGERPRVRDAEAAIYSALYRMSRPQSVLFVAGHGKRLLTGAFSPDGRLAVTGADDGYARLWDVKTGALLHEWKDDTRSVQAAAFSPDGRIVATGGSDGQISLRDAATGAPLAPAPRADWVVGRLAFSPDGQLLAAGTWSGKVLLIEPATGRLVAVLTAGKGWVYGLAFSPDGTRLLASAGTGVRVWNVATLAPVAELGPHKEEIWHADWSPDGLQVVTTSNDATVGIWDGRTGALVRRLAWQEKSVHSAGFSPDGRRIVTCAEDDAVRVWEAATGKELLVLKAHTRFTTECRYTPDGAFILTASYDRTARVWDAATGETVAVLAGHSDGIRVAEFSPDLNYVLTGAWDGQVGLWRFFPKTADLIAYAGGAVSRSLTPSERSQFRIEEP